MSSVRLKRYPMLMTTSKHSMMVKLMASSNSVCKPQLLQAGSDITDEDFTIKFMGWMAATREIFRL